MKLASLRFMKLKESLQFDAIAFSGSSGCAVAFNLAARHRIPLVYVRKSNEDSHGSSVECNVKTLHVRKYLIVDDFIDSGNTVDYIVRAIKKHAVKSSAYIPKQVGVLCFDSYIDRDRKISTDENTFNMFTCN
jgi:adenine/guanine phosphoribosyltransferase-like PRPP-binding protein